MLLNKFGYDFSRSRRTFPVGSVLVMNNTEEKTTVTPWTETKYVNDSLDRDEQIPNNFSRTLNIHMLNLKD